MTEEEAVRGVEAAEVFVVVEAGEDCRVVGQDEELSGDNIGGFIAEDDTGIGAKIVEAGLDGGPVASSVEGLQQTRGGGDGGRGAVGVEGAVDEEEVGHIA